VTPYRDSVDGTRDHATYQKLLRKNVTGMFGALSVFSRRIKGMVTSQLEQVWTGSVTFYNCLLRTVLFSVAIHLWNGANLWCCHCEMEWTQENVIEIIELYKRK
jgi:hypothetical protein